MEKSVVAAHRVARGRQQVLLGAAVGEWGDRSSGAGEVALGALHRVGDTPVALNAIFNIHSMTKPITGAAILMLQDEGKLHVSDLVSKHIPAFAELKTPSGKPANLTIAQMMTHTSGLGEGANNAPSELSGVTTLAHLVPHWLDSPMKFEPGSRRQYTQSGINCAGRIIEILTGQDFDEFLELIASQPKLVIAGPPAAGKMRWLFCHTTCRAIRFAGKRASKS